MAQGCGLLLEAAARPMSAYSSLLLMFMLVELWLLITAASLVLVVMMTACTLPLRQEAALKLCARWVASI